MWRSTSPHSLRVNLRYGDAHDKIEQYKWFEENQVPSVPFTVSRAQAMEWIQQGNTVLARTLTKASEGRGIVVMETVEQAENITAPVYTKYVPKKKEFRVHIFKDRVVAVLEKRRRNGVSGDVRIRNTANGYVFCREGVEEPIGIRELALKARGVTKSDFAGVDIGFNVKKNHLFVIECNSAPGIEGSNVIDYCNEIVKEL